MPALAQAHFASLPGALQMVVADARNEAAVARAMEGAECMVIMAAVTAGVEREAAAPEAVIEVNVKSVATGAVGGGCKAAARAAPQLRGGLWCGRTDRGAARLA